ncbi:glycosyltransferase [Chloroflexi bacterium TSY]|nr:glycosyltransferase [Chloroflexi bacterium TSY]
MRWYERKNGISVLIACQNEEALIELCIRSFLEFGDELIVVDNGSTDRSKEIVQALQTQYPEKIKFFDVPELPDLYHNRQYAFEQSSYRWVMRADSDFVAYTDGEYDIRKFREFLLDQKRGLLPKAYSFPFANISLDFFHTGLDRSSEQIGPHDPGRYIPPPVTPARGRARIYEVFPGFRFQRLGRGEGVRFNRIITRLRTPYDQPL